jgi:hypothetical protein
MRETRVVQGARRAGGAALAGLLGLWAAGCGPEGAGGTETGSEALSAWAGQTPHFSLVGRLNGEDLRLELSGADAADRAKLFCKREYLVPLVGGQRDYARGFLSEVKVDAFVTVGGQARMLELEFKQHDLQKDAPGAALTVAPRVEGVPLAPDALWLEAEWHVDGVQVYERAAQMGTFTLGAMTGQPDATGLVVPRNTGSVGGFFSTRWSETEFLTVSFTALCTKSTVTEFYDVP